MTVPHYAILKYSHFIHLDALILIALDVLQPTGAAADDYTTDVGAA